MDIIPPSVCVSVCTCVSLCAFLSGVNLTSHFYAVGDINSRLKNEINEFPSPTLIFHSSSRHRHYSPRLSQFLQTPLIFLHISSCWDMLGFSASCCSVSRIRAFNRKQPLSSLSFSHSLSVVRHAPLQKPPDRHPEGSAAWERGKETERSLAHTHLQACMDLPTALRCVCVCVCVSCSGVADGCPPHLTQQAPRISTMMSLSAFVSPDCSSPWVTAVPPRPQSIRRSIYSISVNYYNVFLGQGLHSVSLAREAHSIHPSIYLSMLLSICLSFYLSISLSIQLSIHLVIYLCIHPSIHLSIYFYGASTSETSHRWQMDHARRFLECI